ncbi:MAG: hypothetical protein IKR73_06350, partial [Oscillospiraceae bacterium]|nr:hypothetical protein [Oscillospiraceae bacterium]
ATGSLTKFNNELLAGNVPDILIIEEGMPYDSYVNKGLFTDLYGIMDQSGGVKRGDILPNVLTAMEDDGKLMFMCTAFNILTCGADPAFVDGDGYLKMSTVQAQSDKTVADGMDRETFLMYGVYFSNFFDLKNKKCDFDNPAFKALLEESKKHPQMGSEPDWMDDPEANNDREQAFMNGKEMLYFINKGDFDLYYDKAHLGKSFTYTNFPSDAPTAKSLIAPTTLFAISEKSNKKTAAWEFMSTVLKGMIEVEPYSYWDENNVKHNVEGDNRYNAWNGFPVLTADFDMLKSHAGDAYHYYDETGKAIYEDKTIWLGESEVKMDLLNEQEINDWANMVTGTTTTVPSVSEIYETIIKDEVQNYWAGTSSVDQAASMIQSRVSLYISEHY